MTDQVARRIVLMVAVGIAWGFLCDAMDVPLGWWIAGLVVLDLIVWSVNRTRKPKRVKRVGPPMEWID